MTDVSIEQESSNEGQLKKLPIGISSCLLGERVRYDGGHKNNAYINGTLGEYFEFRPFCPELAIGLGIRCLCASIGRYN